MDCNGQQSIKSTHQNMEEYSAESWLLQQVPDCFICPTVGITGAPLSNNGHMISCKLPTPITRVLPEGYSNQQMDREKFGIPYRQSVYLSQIFIVLPWIHRTISSPVQHTAAFSKVRMVAPFGHKQTSILRSYFIP